MNDTEADQTLSARRESLRLWLQLIKAARTIEADIGSRFRKTHGQSLARFDVLSQPCRFDNEWMAIGVLAKHLMAASGNITALLDRMANEGLIERRSSPSDRRSHQIRMTASGRTQFEAMARDHAEWAHTALSDLSIEDKATLTELLVRVRRAFEEQEMP